MDTKTRTIERDMTEAVDYRSEPERKPRARTDLLWVILPTLLAGAILGIAGQYGNRFVTAADSSLVLSTKVDQILEQTKTQAEQNRSQDTLLREMIQKQGTLLTRDEFQRYQDLADRRFIRFEQSMADQSRRIDGLEMTVKLIQQTVIDRTAPRHP